ncbi:MAG: amidohydrolase family protein [Planctomycetota bacterium]
MSALTRLLLILTLAATGHAQGGDDRPAEAPAPAKAVQDGPLGTWKAKIPFGQAQRVVEVTIELSKRDDGLWCKVTTPFLRQPFEGTVTEADGVLKGTLSTKLGERSIDAPFEAKLEGGHLVGKVRLMRDDVAFDAVRPGQDDAAGKPAEAAKDAEAGQDKAAPAEDRPGEEKVAEASGPKPGESLLVKAQPRPAKQARDFVIDYGHRPKPEDCKVARWGPKDFDSPDQALRVRKLFPITSDPIQDAVVLVHRGKITAVGRASEVRIPDGYTVVDCGDGWLFPGFVDLHCHIASGSFDLNDTVHPTNPEFRTLDLIELDRPHVKKALQGGVTTTLYIPGSGSNMGGFGTVTKLAGKTADEALVRFPGSLKIAQAGNPERRTGDMGAGRIGMNFGLRATLERGRRYYQAWEDYDAGRSQEKPKEDPALENLRGLFRHEYPVSVHTQGYQVCLETLRQLHDEFGLWVFVDHGSFNAFRMAEQALVRGVPIANGPRMYQIDYDTGEMWGTAGLWARGGDLGWDEDQLGVGRDGIAINTDSPVVPQEELTVQAACAVRLGLPWEWAIRGLTINPARFVGVESRVGSIEVGKDADMVLWTGDPLDPRRHVRKVMVSGNLYYDCDPGGKDHGKRRF